MIPSLLLAATLFGGPYKALPLDSIPAGRAILFNTVRDSIPDFGERKDGLVKYDGRTFKIDGKDKPYGLYRKSGDKLVGYTFSRYSGDSLFITASFDGDGIEKYLALCLLRSDLAQVYGPDESGPGRYSHRGSSSRGTGKVFAGGLIGGLVGFAAGTWYVYEDNKTDEERVGYPLLGAAVGVLIGTLIGFTSGD
jgi:hypothetical protein